MFYAVTDLLTIATMGRVIAIQPFYANPTQPNPTHNVPVKIQPNPTHGWTQPTSMSVCASDYNLF